MAHEVANEGSAIVCGSLSPVISYTREGDLQKARQEFERQLEPFMEHNVDFILAEVSSVACACVGSTTNCVCVRGLHDELRVRAWDSMTGHK